MCMQAQFIDLTTSAGGTRLSLQMKPIFQLSNSDGRIPTVGGAVSQ